MDSRTASGDVSQIFAQYAWMARRDSEERKRRPFRAATILFPVTQGMNTDAHGTGEPCLSQPDEVSQSGNVFTRTDWQAFNVAPMGGALNIGDTVEVTVVSAGCQPNGHFGEVYVDQFATAFALPNISVSAPNYAVANSDLTYRVTVKNGGGFATTNTTVQFNTPMLTDTSNPAKLSRLGFVAVNSAGVSCTAPNVGTAGTVTCNIGTLGAGGSYTFTVTVRVLTIPGAYALPVYVNAGTYSVVSDQTSTLNGNLVQTLVTTSIPVDISATLTDGVASLQWGQPDTYTLVVKNNGPTPVDGVTIPDALNGFAFSGMNWTCTHSSRGACGGASGAGTLNTTANLPVGESVTYTIKATAINKTGGGSGPGNALYRITAALPAGYVQTVAFNNQATDLNNNDSTAYSLAINKDVAGTGTGVIVAYPGGFSCGTACSGLTKSFASDTSVAVTATTSPGSAFAGWALLGGASGTCGGVSGTCVTTVAGNATIAAKFDGISLVSTLSATSNSDLARVRPGDTADYTVTVHVPNNYAWPVTITDAFPTGLSYVSSSTPVITGTMTCGVGSCTAPTVTAEASTTFAFGNVTCATPAGCSIRLYIRGQVANTAARGTSLETVLGATYAVDQHPTALTVIEPNITLTRSAAPSNGLLPGQHSTVTVTLANNTGGTDAALNGQLWPSWNVSDNLPSSLIFLS